MLGSGIPSGLPIIVEPILPLATGVNSTCSTFLIRHMSWLRPNVGVVTGLLKASAKARLFRYRSRVGMKCVCLLTIPCPLAWTCSLSVLVRVLSLPLPVVLVIVLRASLSVRSKFYLTRLVTSWSYEITNREVLYDVNNTIFAKFIDMLIRTYQILGSASHNAGSATDISSYLKLLPSPEQLTESIRHLENYGMELEVKEFTQIINTMN